MVTTKSTSVAAASLKAGQAVIIPTDTVYGLALSVDATEGLQQLFELKGREQDKPIAWLVADPGQIERYGKDVPGYALALAQAFWPGPLTLVVRAGDSIAGPFLSDERTIGLRMPDNATTLAILNLVAGPLATTSANLSGEEPPMTFAEIDPRLLAQVPVALEDDNRQSGVASTVVDCSGNRPRIVREGAVTAEDIARVLEGGESGGGNL